MHQFSKGRGLDRRFGDGEINAEVNLLDEPSNSVSLL